MVPQRDGTMKESGGRWSPDQRALDMLRKGTSMVVVGYTRTSQGESALSRRWCSILVELDENEFLSEREKVEETSEQFALIGILR